MVLKKLQKKVTESLEDFVNKGSHDVFENKAKEPKKWIFFPLRIRQDISSKIDSLVEERVGLSKTAWILEAIQEKIKRENY